MAQCPGGDQREVVSLRDPYRDQDFLICSEIKRNLSKLKDNTKLSIVANPAEGQDAIWKDL